MSLPLSSSDWHIYLTSEMGEIELYDQVLNEEA